MLPFWNIIRAGTFIKIQKNLSNLLSGNFAKKSHIINTHIFGNKAWAVIIWNTLSLELDIPQIHLLNIPLSSIIL